MSSKLPFKGSVQSKRSARIQKRNEEITGIPFATATLPKKKLQCTDKNDFMEMDEDEYSAYSTSSQQPIDDTNKNAGPLTTTDLSKPLINLSDSEE